MEFAAELYLIIVIVYTFPIHCYDLASIKIICIHCAETLVFFKTTLFSSQLTLLFFNPWGTKASHTIIIVSHYVAWILCGRDPRARARARARGGA